MSFCTYTAQGFLLCPKNKQQHPHYSTIGFESDAQAGVFIEPFEQQEPVSIHSDIEPFEQHMTGAPLENFIKQSN